MHSKAVSLRIYIERALPWVLAAILFCLPFQTVWILDEQSVGGSSWTYATIGVYAIDLVIILCALGMFLVRRAGTAAPGRYAILCALVTVSFFSIFFSSDQHIAWYHFLILIEGVLLVWIFGSRHVHPAKIITAFGCAGAIQSILAMVQIGTQRVSESVVLGLSEQSPATAGVSVIESADAIWGRFLRGYGTFPHPNILAGFLAVCLILLVVGVAMARTRRLRVMTFAAIVLVSTGLLLTMSRAAIGISAAAVIVVVCAGYLQTGMGRFARRGLMAAGVSILLTWIVIGSFLMPLVTTRITGETRLEALSTNERLNGYEDARILLTDDWLHGVGIGNATVELKDTDPSRPAWRLHPVHNIYLLAAVELGVFGALFFIGQLAYLLAYIFRTYLSLGAYPWILGVGGALFTLILLGFFDHYPWSLHAGSILLWSIVGLGFGATSPARVGRPDIPGSSG